MQTRKVKSPNRKHKTCTQCGLQIRCGDVERHDQGYHHKTSKKYRK